MLPKFTHLQRPFGSRACAAVLSAIFLTFPSLASATAVSDLTSSPPLGDQSDLAFGVANTQPFPFLLGSFNGLIVKNEVDEAGEARGLDLVPRAPPGIGLGNNQFQTSEIKMGDTQWFYFSKEDLGGKGINATSNSQNADSSESLLTDVYLSLTTCSGPALDTTKTKNVTGLPQLAVYVSLSGKEKSKQNMTRAEEGYMGTIVSADGDIYIGVEAPDDANYYGSYSYEIGASTDTFFHSYNDTVELLALTDTSSNAALLTTYEGGQNLTDSQSSLWNNSTPVYTMFAYNANTTAAPIGLQRSYCAIKRLSQISKGSNLEISMTSRNNQLQEQFYITGLNRSSTYVGVLAMEGNSTKPGNGIIGGGGKVWKPLNFTTKTDNNCALVFDMKFCTEIAQAVPAQPSINLSELRTLYDNNSASLYQNFNYSLQQVQCNTVNESIYSMAVTCKDCDKAYRDWLCAVTVPRCDDFSYDMDDPTSVIRNAAQPFLNGTKITNQTILNISSLAQSRNQWIDDHIKPGPYREILPSVSMCYDLVKKCPTTLGFGCPKGNLIKYSYVASAAPSTFSRPPTSIQVLFSAIPVACGFLWLF